MNVRGGALETSADRFFCCLLANDKQIVPLQPLAQQVRQLAEALEYLGEPLSPVEVAGIDKAIANPDENAAGLVFRGSTGNPKPSMELTRRDAADRWPTFPSVINRPCKGVFPVSALEYQILEVYSRDAGQRSAKISFNLSQGSQDIGFRGVLPAAHTNPVFVMANDQPIRASPHSAEWCLNAVNECWTQKAPRMSPADQVKGREA